MIYLTYKETSDTVQEKEEGEGDGPYDGFSRTEHTFEPIALFREHPGGYCEELSTSFDTRHVSTLWLVVVRYYDGGTFGTDSGLWIVEGIFLNEKDATNLKSKIRDGTYKGISSKGYFAWVGYFAGLEDVEIHEMDLLPTVMKIPATPLNFPSHIVALSRAVSRGDESACPALHDALVELRLDELAKDSWTVVGPSVANAIIGNYELCPELNQCSMCREIHKYLKRVS